MSRTRENAIEEKGSGETNLAVATSSASVSIVRHLRPTLFSPQTTIKSSALINLPNDLLGLTGSYLEDKQKSLIKLAQTSKSAYQALYPAIKTALVKVLKELVEQDDTVQVEKLLRCHPYLQLRTDEVDPEGLAYKDIKTTPYQDTLAEPLSEEMRGVLEEGFPGETKEERLAHAALQSEEFKHSRFDKLREEKRKIKEFTQFAYDTWKSRYRAWQESGYADTHLQPLRDAWMRVALAQRKWPKRLRKIFSVVNMDEKQTFENLPRDLPEPHFYGDTKDLWRADTIGCDLYLLPVAAEQDLMETDFINNLRATSNGQPMLIRQGEEENVTYHLYAPYVSLDKDESEWRLIHIDDPNIIQLIRGRPLHPELQAPLDSFSGALPCASLFEELYKFGNSRSLHLGSGFYYIFAAYNYPSGPGRDLAWRACRVHGSAAGQHRANSVAVATLFETRTERLAKHRADLEHYLPREALGLRR